MGSAAQRLSTSTLTRDGRLVPWLAATGPLAYSVDAPPDRDYFFQYGWVLPGILNPVHNLRRHYYFGTPFKTHAREPFAFWNAARARDVESVYVREGRIEKQQVRAPVAVYRWQWRRDEAVMLVQHGSYQWVDAADQPLLQAGTVRLYRGLQKARVVREPPLPASGDGDDLWQKYLAVQAKVLADSVTSFNSVHDRVKRCETGHIRDGTWMTNDVARDEGLPIEGAAAGLWRAAHTSYSLAHWVAERKFGPAHVVCETPIDNIRLTTFFCGENEVRVVDPRLVTTVDVVGCHIR